MKDNRYVKINIIILSAYCNYASVVCIQKNAKGSFITLTIICLASHQDLEFHTGTVLLHSDVTIKNPPFTRMQLLSYSIFVNIRNRIFVLVADDSCSLFNHRSLRLSARNE